jgi:hypothetical protein
LEKYHEVLPTTIPGLIIMARDIYRDLGLSREERDEQIEALKMLSVEEFRNYLKSQILYQMHRNSQKSKDPPSTAANVVEPGAVAGDTHPSHIATGDATSAAAPGPIARDTPGSGTSRFTLFYNQ